MTAIPTQLFILGSDLFAAVKSWKDIDQTANALRACGVYQWPYPRFTLRMPIFSWFQYFIPDANRQNTGNVIEIADITTDFCEYRYRMIDPDGVVFKEEKLPIGSEDDIGLEHLTRMLVDFLVVFLSTRNVRKTTTENKVAKLGIGGKKPGSMKRYRYVTTLNLPDGLAESARVESEKTGRRVAPHFRMGHPRRQRYGPRNEFVRMVLVPPVFVNHDLEWTSERVAYNVTVPKKEEHHEHEPA